MLTLIATCLLAAGTTFTPLQEWTIAEIVGGGRPRSISILIPAIPKPDYSTRITMQRSLVPGQVAEPPQGCTLKLKAKE